MKISELIKELTNGLNREGDLEVKLPITEFDTMKPWNKKRWFVELTCVSVEVDKNDEAVLALY